jgi:hypothetical protein
MFSQPLASISKPSVISNSEAILPGRGLINARQHPQQRALAGAVGADDANAIAFAQSQGNVIERAHFHGLRGPAAKHAFDEILFERDAPVGTHPKG